MTRQRALSVGFRTNRPAKAKVSFRNIQHPANIQTQSMANETRSHTKGIGYSAKDESGDIATDVYYATGSGTYVANRDRDLEDGQAAIHNRVEPTTAEYTGIRIHKTARMAPTLRDIVRLTSCAANDGHIFSVRKTRKSVSLIMHTRSLAYEVGHPDPAGYIQAKGSSTGWHLHQMNRNLMALSLSRNQGRR